MTDNLTCCIAVIAMNCCGLHIAAEMKKAVDGSSFIGHDYGVVRQARVAARGDLQVIVDIIHTLMTAVFVVGFYFGLREALADKAWGCAVGFLALLLVSAVLLVYLVRHVSAGLL